MELKVQRGLFIDFLINCSSKINNMAELDNNGSNDYVSLKVTNPQMIIT